MLMRGGALDDSMPKYETYLAGKRLVLADRQYCGTSYTTGGISL